MFVAKKVQLPGSIKPGRLTGVILKSGSGRGPPLEALLMRLERQIEGLFRLNREADRNIGGTIEGLQHLIAKQAAIRALGTWTGSQLDAAIAGMTNGTSQI